MVCKEAMFASGTFCTFCAFFRVTLCALGSSAWTRDAINLFMLRCGSRNESQYGGPMALGELKVGELARRRILLFSRNPCSAVKMLRKWHSLSRLVTRTKESDVYASIWVSNPYAQ